MNSRELSLHQVVTLFSQVGSANPRYAAAIVALFLQAYHSHDADKKLKNRLLLGMGPLLSKDLNRDLLDRCFTCFLEALRDPSLKEAALKTLASATKVGGGYAERVFDLLWFLNETGINARGHLNRTLNALSETVPEATIRQRLADNLSSDHPYPFVTTALKRCHLGSVTMGRSGLVKLLSDRSGGCFAATSLDELIQAWVDSHCQQTDLLMKLIGKSLQEEIPLWIAPGDLLCGHKKIPVGLATRLKTQMGQEIQEFFFQTLEERVKQFTARIAAKPIEKEKRRLPHIQSQDARLRAKFLFVPKMQQATPCVHYFHSCQPPYLKDENGIILVTQTIALALLTLQPTAIDYSSITAEIARGERPDYKRETPYVSLGSDGGELNISIPESLANSPTFRQKLHLLGLAGTTVNFEKFTIRYTLLFSVPKVQIKSFIEEHLGLHTALYQTIREGFPSQFSGEVQLLSFRRQTDFGPVSSLRK